MSLTTYTAPFEITMAEENPANVGLVREAIHENELNCRLRVIMPVIVLTSSRSSIIEEMGAWHAALVYFQEPHTLAEFVELGAIIRRVPGRAKKQNEPENPANGKNAGCVE